MRKVVGGNGLGIPDGLTPYAMLGALNFFPEDIGMMVNADVTAIERLEAAAFTGVKNLMMCLFNLDIFWEIRYN